MPKADGVSRTRFAWWRAAAIAWSALSMAAVAATLAGLEIDRTPMASSGQANLAHLWPWWLASLSGWCGLTGLWLNLRRREGEDREAGPAGFWRTALFVVGLAALARVAVLAGHTPSLSDDVYRYVFDGANSAAGINPYLVVPAERTVAPGNEHRGGGRWPGEARVAARVNNAEMTTIYLPAAQHAFHLVAALDPRPSAAPPEARALLYRIAFVVVEAVAVGFLLALLRGRRRSAWWLALYAWHPLPLSEIAGSGHQDVLGAALLLAALLIHLRVRRGIWAWSGLLGAAALVKPIVLPVALFLLRGRRGRDWILSAGVGIAVIAAIAAPLLLTDGGAALSSLEATAGRFGLKWAHFGSLYEWLLAAIEKVALTWGNDPQEQLARAICMGLFLVVLARVWWRGTDAWRDSSVIFLAMVLLSPTAHPWYLLWPLALMPVAPGPAVWVASLTIPWGYAVLGDVREWVVPAWVVAAAYVPVYGAVIAEILHRSRSA